MAFSINASGTPSSSYSSSNSQGINKSLNNLSSGSQLNNAAYNAAGLAIANQLSAQVSGMGQAIQNSNESIGMLQIADGGMQGINDNMDRIRVLTLQASNGTMSDSNRGIIQNEIDTLMEASNDIAKQTSYNGMSLLDGTGGSSGDGTFVTQSGADIGNTQSVTIGDAQVASLFGGATIDVTTAAGRSSALDSIDNALEGISDIRSELGASQNQLMSNIRNTSVTQINTASAESQMRDVDFALESANFSRQNIMSQVGSFAQAQANASGANVTRLFS